MIKPVDQMSEGERWLWIEMELKAIRREHEEDFAEITRRQNRNLAIYAFLAATVGGVVIPRLVTFLMSGLSQVTP